ncbi:MAG: hypothetical protein EXR73_13835 [Myxococcales bacterium]|nr:hypothetical protein [Myxococcales bacterium]
MPRDEGRELVPRDEQRLDAAVVLAGDRQHLKDFPPLGSHAPHERRHVLLVVEPSHDGVELDVDAALAREVQRPRLGLEADLLGHDRRQSRLHLP